MVPDIAAVSSLLREVVEAEIVPRFRTLATGDIKEKGPGDLVTVADEAAERALAARLPDLLPGSVVVGEEGVAADPGVLRRLEAGGAPVWIIDPVDGTYNFAHGRPQFGTLLALAQGTRTLAGWLFDPLGGRLVEAEAGEGVFLNGDRLRLPAAPGHLSAMRGFASGRFQTPEVRARIEAGRAGVEDVGTLFCAAHEYLAILTGEAHFSLYKRTMPWDHAAGVLMVREAGGYAGRSDDGGPYSLTEYDKGLLVAPDPDHWSALRGLLLGT